MDVDVDVDVDSGLSSASWTGQAYCQVFPPIAAIDGIEQLSTAGIVAKEEGEGCIETKHIAKK